LSACNSAWTAAARGSRFCVQSRSRVVSEATASSVFPIASATVFAFSCASMLSGSTLKMRRKCSVALSCRPYLT